MVAGLQKRVGPVRAVSGVPQQPLWVPPGFFFVEARRQIHRRLDANFMRGLNLCAEQVKRQVWMRLVRLRRVIRPAVVALRKDRDAVYMAAPKLLLKLRRRELRADVWNGFRRVEV